jgi:hypothetical protein
MISPFAQTQALINEEELISDQLRIIATDARGLKPAERQQIVSGAELLEELLKKHHLVFQKLLETQAELTAARERVAEMGKMTIGQSAFPTLAGHIEIYGYRVP